MLQRSCIFFLKRCLPALNLETCLTSATSGDFSLLLGTFDNGIQILFHDNTKMEPQKGSGLPEVRNIRCTKLYPLGIITMVKFKAELHFLPLTMRYFIIIRQNKCTSGQGKWLVHKASCNKAVVEASVCVTLFPTSLEKLPPIKTAINKEPGEIESILSENNTVRIWGSKNSYSFPLKFTFHGPIPTGILTLTMLASRLKAASITLATFSIIPFELL